MKKYTLLFILTFLLGNSGNSQIADSASEITLTIISQVNQGNSYVTFPADIGNIEPLMFEANLIPNFYLRESKNSRLMGVLTPQIILRMYQEYSYPVRTPSYLPQVTVYYLLGNEEQAKRTTLYGRLAHHSNGQDGDFFLENGDINLKTGDFSTNFFELGLIRTRISSRFNAYQFFKTSLEIHPKDWSQWELDGIYSRYRWHNAFSIFKLSSRESQELKKRADISIKGEATWLFGDLGDWDVTSLNRINLNLTFFYHPKFLEDLGFFVQFYRGLDYYNIYFIHKLDMFRFGIMTEKIRF
ncbi:MAG: hypothetical protein P1P88_19855 [Bacteroidales bacterium]|nr:hypothetical protein [Bacteroidales bacterium]